MGMDHQDRVSALILELDRHREAIQALPGVVGTGVGYRAGGRPEGDVVVQIFVDSADRVDEVRHRAEAILPKDYVDVVVSGEPVAG
jgi:hypothetical protein